MTILIEDLTFEAILGILPHERTTPQRVRVDCRIDYTYAQGRFINYAEVADQIVETMRNLQFELIETALETLGSILHERFSLIETLELTIRKPDILPHCTVGISRRFTFGN
ncbi:MAG: dihydroneopterin aldolase [Campylobacterota bacterium]